MKQLPQRPAHRIALAWCAFFGILLIAGTIMRVAETLGGMFSLLSLPFGAYAFAMTCYHLLRVLGVVGRGSARALSDTRHLSKVRRSGAPPYRFNPPPGWPTPRLSWIPEPGWEPDRRWPPLPRSWPLWVRIQPRPAPPKRKSPWAVDPAAERIVDQFDQARVTRTLRSRDGLRSLQKTAVECLQLGLTESANLKDAERFGASARSRWHPLEWACRHACDDLLSIAQRVAEELRVAIDTGQRPDQRIVARYRRMLVCVDELVAAKAETIGVNRESLRAPASSNGYQVVAPAGAYAAPWQQAEAVAAAALQQFGFFDARVTGAGADGGLDVTGQDVAAQVKYTGTPVGRPVIQQLLGAANGRKTAFFSLSGYTQQAVEEADARGMALFLITLPSSVRTQNAAARILVRGHDRLGDAARILREWATEGEPPS